MHVAGRFPRITSSLAHYCFFKPGHLQRTRTSSGPRSPVNPRDISRSRLTSRNNPYRNLRFQLAQQNAFSSMAHTTFPGDLPIPTDDGACDHLTNLTIPALPLPPCTNPSEPITLSSLSPGLTILFIYPRTGAPGETVPASWDAIPGARGCTPQACSFRDRLPELKSLGVARVFGLSTQDSAYQREAHERLHLPYELLSDSELKFQRALNLPTFEWEGKKVIRRMCLAIEEGKVVKWWYPIFPPDGNVKLVIDWLKEEWASSKAN